MIKVEKVSEIIKEIAQNQIMSKYKKLESNEIECKSSEIDLVTIADKKSEKEFIKQLTLMLPNSKIIGEESVYKDNSILNLVDDEGYVWVVDPLDGTNNFTKGSEDFGVMVALLKNKETVAGFIYNPLKDDMLIAEKNNGAYINNQKIILKSINKDLKDYNVLYNFDHYDVNKHTNLGDIVSSFKSLFCSAAEYQSLLEQKSDIGFFCGYLKPWDHIAGLLLYKEAGGFSSFMNNLPYSNRMVEKRNLPLLLAPNKEIWQELQSKITYSF